MRPSRILLYIDLRPRQTCHSKDGGSAYSIGVGELGWQYGRGLNSHGTVTNWCTRREWPVKCMSVISARWRSNMPFQRRWKCIRDWVAVELLYNSVKTRSQSVWGTEWWRDDAVEKASKQQKAVPMGLQMSSPGERERNCAARLNYCVLHACICWCIYICVCIV